MSERAPISQALGIKIDATESEWTQKDVMLYALGVGAKPVGELEFVYEGKGPKVLPTYAVIPAFPGMAQIVGKVDINPMMILHGEQGITLHREIPPNAKVSTGGEIVEVWDKGKAAVVNVEVTTSDSDGPIFTSRFGIFVRGAGGFDGERGPDTKSVNLPPEREPDHVWEDTTREEQAAISRLSGDVNPLHVDPDFAKMAGFDAPFIHGLCTYGFVGRGILHTLCADDPANFLGLEARFSDQVYPGDTIITKIWETGDGEAIVQAETQKGNVVLKQAKATYKT
ncbi:MAG: MaoC family dehydratase N-terminal domain-containing protein [Acidimicrobiia bacterium]|nr:MaoC family dehydratase N-terminal domain-containing protein [Acidimicrobiia bacterium]